jgi:hypothetical protein
MHQSNATNSALAYSSILKNLMIEEEDEYNKFSTQIDKDDYTNNILLFSNRHCLLTKIIQNVSTVYESSLSSEIENLKNYLEYMKESNNILRRTIKNYEDINKIKEQDNEY